MNTKREWKIRSWNTGALVGAALLYAGCAGQGTGNGSEQPRGEELSSASFALSGEDLVGKSVQICGSRPAPMDASECEYDIGCDCYDFSDDGTILDPATGQSLVLTGLCPSTDPAPADWTFDYEIYDGAGCMGAASTDYTCFDVNDLSTRTNPNQSVEPLDAGLSTNRVVCIAENAAKEWLFTTCRLNEGSLSDPSMPTVFDCGCSPDPMSGACGCDQGFWDHMPTGCTLNPTSCDVECSSDDTFACDDSFYATQRTASNTTSVFKIDPYTGVRTPVATVDGYGFEALGFNPADGYLYAVTQVNPAAQGSGPRLLRIDAQGDVTDLGSLGLPAILTGLDWHAGTFASTGEFIVIASDANDVLHIDVDAVTSVSYDNDRIGNTLVALAQQPGGEDPYGVFFTGTQSGLYRYDLDLLQYDFLGGIDEISDWPCGAAFHQSQAGEMFILCGEGGTWHTFTVDVASYAVSDIASFAFDGEIQDLASCVPAP